LEVGSGKWEAARLTRSFPPPTSNSNNSNPEFTERWIRGCCFLTSGVGGKTFLDSQGQARYRDGTLIWWPPCSYADASAKAFGYSLWRRTRSSEVEVSV